MSLNDVRYRKSILHFRIDLFPNEEKSSFPNKKNRDKSAKNSFLMQMLWLSKFDFFSQIAFRFCSFSFRGKMEQKKKEMIRSSFQIIVYADREVYFFPPNLNNVHRIA
jgi:hypothetical protein